MQEVGAYTDTDELNRLIAENVFGWERVGSKTALAPFAYRRPDGHVVHPYSAPDYSASIATAMEVVEKLRVSFAWDIESWATSAFTGWEVKLWKGGDIAGENRNESLPLAICHAALEAISGKD